MTDFDINIGASTRSAFSGIIGKRCCRQRAGEYKSLSLGFGEKVPHVRKKSVDSFSGEWEIGTYSAAWRIVKNGAILCGSMNPVDSNEELEQQVDALQLGIVMSIEMLSKFDIRIALDDRTFVEFMCASNDDENVFHIFGPDHLFLGYSPAHGWRLRKSNEPSL
ncbi:hypothetical protein [Undibacterium sp. Ji49W]|uniref:hypothetical protein n=1 Tax=Undibacterium sp. Ji49W TaxID=3413040 RepID=UPI003BF30340